MMVGIGAMLRWLQAPAEMGMSQAGKLGHSRDHHYHEEK